MTTGPVLKSQSPAEFLFRGNAAAAGAFLTRLGDKPIDLDPQSPTTHGESCLPWVGGVSHSLVENPPLRFPQFISYGRCETYAEGRHDGNQTFTTLRASVSDIRITISPSSYDYVPDVKSISFHAGNLSLELQSTYSETTPLPGFKINAAQPVGMSLMVRGMTDKDTPLPVALDFDEHLLSLSSVQQMDEEFLGNRQFFDEHAHRFPTHEKLVFGSNRIPRTAQGYVVTSFVRQIRVGSDVFHGNVLTRKGFGTIQFGVVLADSYNRRVTMARIKMGSDPGGEASFDAVETNGIWR